MFKLILFSLLVFPLWVRAASPDTAIAKPVTSIPEKSERWNRLNKFCVDDFDAYQKEMKVYRTVINGELNALTKDEYMKLDSVFDPNIIFLAMNWPNDLSERDEFWNGNQNCADLHYQALQRLSRASSTVNEKTAAVRLFRSCMMDRFNRKKVIAPFDQLIGCYEERAKKN